MTWKLLLLGLHALGSSRALMALGLCGLLCQMFDDIGDMLCEFLKSGDEQVHDHRLHYMAELLDATSRVATPPIPIGMDDEFSAFVSELSAFWAALLSSGHTLSSRDMRRFFAGPLMVLCGAVLLVGLFVLPGSLAGLLLSLSGGVKWLRILFAVAGMSIKRVIANEPRQRFAVSEITRQR